MRGFLLELLSIGSRLLNVLTGGTADVTFSARNHIERLPTRRLIDLLLGKGHCAWAWSQDVARARETIDMDEAFK